MDVLKTDRVYRKITYTNRYLNADSYHCPAQKQEVLNTLIHRARVISERLHLREELDHLCRVLKKNGYNRANIERAIRTKRERQEPSERLATIYLPYVKGSINKLGRLTTRSCPVLFMKYGLHQIISIPPESTASYVHVGKSTSDRQEQQ